jgi:hypothetical protein
MSINIYISELEQLKNTNNIKLNEFKNNIKLLNEIIENIICDKDNLKKDIDDLHEITNEMNILLKQININLDLV